MRKNRREEHAARLHRARNVFLIAVSLYVAFELLRTGVIEAWVMAASLHIIPGSFIAGALFTSLFTVAPATVALAEMGHVASPWLVAAVGAAGAVVGDLFLFMFVRDAVAREAPLFLNNSQRRRIRVIFKRPFLHWLLPTFGALIILSPLPDELGLALMGISRIRTAWFVPISYAMNFLGILAVALVGRAVL
jgi:hypothetical protein